jgi:hypothetical protein
MGGGANESMGVLGGDRRRFNVAMSRGKVGRIVICNKDLIKGKYHNGPWKTFLEGDETRILGDARFRLAWEGYSRPLFDKFVAVRDAWVKEAMAATERQVGHHNELTPGNAVMARRIRRVDIGWGTEEFIRLTGASTAVALELIDGARGEIHVAIERYYEVYRDNNLDGVEEEVARLDL